MIRKFTLFLYQKGYIQADFSEWITQVLPSVPNSHPLPSVYSDTEIALLLDAVDRSTMKRCRNFAILTLAARLDLRASDIWGTHALRSSLASSMVGKDVPYYAVQKVLDHESPQATKSYIRIDLAGLRKFTIPVPEASGNFARCLEGGGGQ